MKLSYAEFAKSKKVSLLGSWVLLYGPEQHLKREALARLRAEAEGAAEGEASWEALDGASLSAGELLSRSQMGALFGGARVIVVREADGIDKREQEVLAKAIGPLPADVSVVLMTGGSGERRRERGVGAALGRAIEKGGVAIEFLGLKVPEAAKWAVARAGELGKKLEPAAARKLVEQRVGTGLSEIEAEVEKLTLFVGEMNAVGSSHVEEVSPRLVEEDVFRLLDAVGKRNAGRAVSILRGLMYEQKENPSRVLGMLAQHVRLIWQTKLLMEAGWRPGREAGAEAEGLLPREERRNALTQFARKPWLARRTMGQARAYSWAELRRAMAALHGCDLAMKEIEGKVSDEAGALELLVVQLCTDLAMPLWEDVGVKGTGS